MGQAHYAVLPGPYRNTVLSDHCRDLGTHVLWRRAWRWSCPGLGRVGRVVAALLVAPLHCRDVDIACCTAVSPPCLAVQAAPCSSCQTLPTQNTHTATPTHIRPFRLLSRLLNAARCGQPGGVVRFNITLFPNLFCQLPLPAQKVAGGRGARRRRRRRQQRKTAA